MHLIEKWQNLHTKSSIYSLLNTEFASKIIAWSIFFTYKSSNKRKKFPVSVALKYMIVLTQVLAEVLNITSLEARFHGNIILISTVSPIN